MPTVSFYHLDVFCKERFCGNPLAVFPDTSLISEQYFQAIANELNLSETVFLLPATDPDCDFKLRIFTPQTELPFAGHPLVGTGVLAAQLGLIDPGRAFLNCQLRASNVQIGIVRKGPDILATLTHPKPQFLGALSETQVNLVAAALGSPRTAIDRSMPVEALSTGLPFLIVPVKSLALLNAISINPLLFAQLETVLPTPYVYAFIIDNSTVAPVIHCRCFLPTGGIPEDPATGSAAGVLGAYLVRHGLGAAAMLRSTTTIKQGDAMGRPSVITLDLDRTAEPVTIRVSGSARLVYRGEWIL